MIPDLTGTPLQELTRLDGKVAVVTGGAVGIGRGIAARLAEAGATVIAADIDGVGAVATAAELSTSGAHVVGRELDVTDSDAISSVADAAVAEFGSLDIWVNNAGIYPAKSFLEMTDDDWRAVMAVNLDGAMVGAREAARRMVTAERPGTILNIVSVSGYRGRPSLAHYSASKHAVRGLTRSLAVELGPHGIRVLAIAPTMVATPGTEAASRRFADGANGPRVDVYQQLPLGRAAVPDDIARVALFCVSDLAALMTGSTVIVDAGQMSM
jgi:NAD(P)-dependent dehydrogenase (short-subunit alcohol dehydrogenase family)